MIDLELYEQRLFVFIHMTCTRSMVMMNTQNHKNHIMLNVEEAL